MDLVLVAALAGLTSAALAALGARRGMRSELDDVRRRLEQVSAELQFHREAGNAPAPSAVPAPELLITTATEPLGAPAPTVPERVVLSATLGEPLIKAAAFVYAVRRALAAENRNRIAFEMRREVRRSRKRRRRGLPRTRRQAAA